jgi:hypothetical protein
MQLHHLPGLLNPADDFTSGDKKDAEISTAWQQKLFRGPYRSSATHGYPILNT